MLSIHNNLSASAQNVTGAYVIIMLVYVYRRLLTKRLHGKACSYVIANNARKCKIYLVKAAAITFIM